MTVLEQLRLLIRDKESLVFDSAELFIFLQQTATSYAEPETPDPGDALDGYEVNVYRAAVRALSVVLADPKRMQSYARGGVSWTRGEIWRALEEYRAAAGDGIASITVTKVY